MIPLAIPNLCGNEGKYLQECIETTFVSSVGPFVTRFEESVALASGAQFAVATSSGTTGLHLALIGVGVGAGDLVLLPSFTFIASANAIAHCGALPWLVDIDPESWTMDAALLEKILRTETKLVNGKRIHQETGRRVAAVLPVHTLGVPADMDRMRAVAQEFSLPLIADAAPALGALYKGRPIGGEADLSVFSFNGNKTVTAGAGGMIVGNDLALMKRLKHLSSTARVGTDYLHDAVGYNYRMTNLQGAVGCAQMENLGNFIEAKKKIDRVYRQNLSDIDEIAFFPKSPWGESVCWFSGIVLKDGCRRNITELTLLLRGHGIESRPFWRPVHLQPMYCNSPRTDQSVSESIWNRILTLPCSTQLTTDQQQEVIQALRNSLC